MAAHVKQMAGEKFGRLTAISICGKEKSRGLLWNVVCECGTEFVASGGEVRRGGITECRQCAKARKVNATSSHKKTGTAEHRAWLSMKRRCTNKNSFAYDKYGGRGITICEAWMDSFLSFFEDMGPRPTDTHSLDRIDVNGNYSPENCRWATKVEQANNKRNNRITEINGKPQTIAIAAREIGITESGLRKRLKRSSSNGRN
ncbi:hypothetical protein [Uliginosibacterium sp. 31-12]|uniref:hypothetical protein n=1 Tax=Uliginosibacterium sp. 31-12 TaxID=3062781 RepID=UPI0026E4771F|nr:hypothetical protein [Uliginosibacterium sp. 31-12]MDO6385620.1 hypothetical protein [Uliginosibacterium sp. 31-12]